MKIKVLSNVLDTGMVYARKGDVVIVSNEIGESLCKGGKKARAEKVADTVKAINEPKDA